MFHTGHDFARRGAYWTLGRDGTKLPRQLAWMPSKHPRNCCSRMAKRKPKQPALFASMGRTLLHRPAFDQAAEYLDRGRVSGIGQTDWIWRFGSRVIDDQPDRRQPNVLRRSCICRNRPVPPRQLTGDAKPVACTGMGRVFVSIVPPTVSTRLGQPTLGFTGRSCFPFPFGIATLAFLSVYGPEQCCHFLDTLLKPAFAT